MTESNIDTGQGDKVVGVPGIVLMVVGLMLIFSLLTYVLMKIWPHCQPDESVARAASTPTPTPTASPKPDQQPAQVPGQPASQGSVQQPNQAAGQQASQEGGQQASQTADQKPAQAGSQQTNQKPEEPKSDQPPKSVCPIQDDVTFFWGTRRLWWEARLLMIVMLAGAMGSLVHALRSMYWYIGKGDSPPFPR